MKIHIIPVGGDEPIHSIPDCWCNPLEKEGNLAVHHAKDCREKFERQGIEDPEKFWVNVGEE